MTATATTPLAVAALEQRLQQIAGVLLDPAAADTADPAVLLDRVVGVVVDDPTPERVWLLLVGLAGCLPDDADVRRAMRALRLRDRTDATLWLLDHALAAAAEAGTADRPLELLVDAVVCDVSHAAGFDLHTGIQRVVRSTLPIWERTHEIHLVALTPGGHALRRLRPPERDRVLRWSETHAGGRQRPSTEPDSLRDDDVLVVPWRSHVVVIEVPAREACGRFATLAQWSGNRLLVVGHDCIPVVSALAVPIEEPNRFVHYLTAIKYTSVVAGVSVSATQEFRGFAAMLAAQGLEGPRVVECRLPVDDGGVPATSPAGDTDEPLVLCVGSREPRKNHLAVLYAAEVLWREGLRFRLRFVGGSAWGQAVPREVARLARHGRPVEIHTAVTDEELEASYREARFTVFVSWHEGYGLPLAESIARGVPALTADFGSLREIAQGGGALLVDPRDDDQIVDGMRTLLTDDAVVADLRAQIAARPSRTWSDYAAQLWDTFGLSRAAAEPSGPDADGAA